MRGWRQSLLVIAAAYAAFLVAACGHSVTPSSGAASASASADPNSAASPAMAAAKLGLRKSAVASCRSGASRISDWRLRWREGV